MKNKVIFIVVGLLIFIGIIIFLSAKQRQMVSPFGLEVTPTVQLISTNLKKYQDPSGFKFSYPENFKVLTQETDDESIYSLLEIASDEASGSISLRVEDSNLETLDEWQEENEKMTVSTTSKNIKLGDVDGIEFASQEKIITVALDQGVLFTIEVLPKEKSEIWLTAYDTLISSFTFSQPENQEMEQKNEAPAASEEDVVFEGEEVIE